MRGPRKALQPTPARRRRSTRWVRRDRSSRAHRFRAIVSQEQYIGGRLQALADSVCGGSFTPLLTQLVRGKRLKKGDLDELQALLGKLSGRRKP